MENVTATKISKSKSSHRSEFYSDLALTLNLNINIILKRWMFRAVGF